MSGTPSKSAAKNKLWINARPKLVQGDFIFEQENDCCYVSKDGLGTSSLRIRVADGGGGAFLVLETKRWAFDSVQELTEMIAPIQKMIADFPSDK